MQDERRKKRKKKAAVRRRIHNQILWILFFGIIILFTALSLIRKDKSYSESENRSLAQFPAFSVESLCDGSYFSGLTDYVADQFFARDSWIALKLVEDRALGKKEAGGCFLGKKGYLLANPDTPDEEAVTNSIDAINAFTEKFQDLNYYMMIAPAAANVITQYLPANAPAHDQIADIDRIYSSLDSKISTIDVGSALAAHSEDYIYYKTDHHWTSMGAYDAFAEAAATLGISSPVAEYNIYTVAEDFQGTLSSKSGSHSSRDTVQLYVPQTDVKYYVYYPDSETKIASMYSSDALETKDKYTVFFGGNHPLVEIRTTADTQRNLLIFKDSYANSFIQFLTPYYDRIIMVDPRYYYDSIDTALNTYGITDVLYLYSGNTFVTDTSLADVLNSAIADDEDMTAEEAGMTADVGTEDTETTAAGETESSAAGTESSAAGTESTEAAAAGENAEG